MRVYADNAATTQMTPEVLEAMYACIGAAVGISLSVFLSYKTVPFIYQERWLIFWIAAALALCIGNGKQCVAMIKRTEELAWNLS